VGIVNVLSVAAKANVCQEGELDEHKTKNGLYWRWAFNFLTSQLSVRLLEAIIAVFDVV
jgi:hypothetical protein